METITPGILLGSQIRPADVLYFHVSTTKKSPFVENPTEMVLFTTVLVASLLSQPESRAAIHSPDHVKPISFSCPPKTSISHLLA